MAQSASATLRERAKNNRDRRAVDKKAVREKNQCSSKSATPPETPNPREPPLKDLIQATHPDRLIPGANPTTSKL
jgi:hypothetical protein